MYLRYVMKQSGEIKRVLLILYHKYLSVRVVLYVGDNTCQVSGPGGCRGRSEAKCRTPLHPSPRLGPAAGASAPRHRNTAPWISRVSAAPRGRAAAAGDTRTRHQQQLRLSATAE